MFSSTVAYAYSNFFFFIVHENTYKPIGYWLFHARFAAETPNYENYTDNFHDISRANDRVYDDAYVYTVRVCFFSLHTFILLLIVLLIIYVFVISTFHTLCVLAYEHCPSKHARSIVGVVKNGSSVVCREKAAHTMPRRRRITNAHIDGIFKNNKQS